MAPQQQYDPNSYARPPGTQAPQKYPFTGNNYAIYGEQPGYVYDPWSDQYHPDPSVYNEYMTDAGLQKEEPGLWDQVKPLAVATGATEAVKAGVTNPVGVYEGITGIFGGGGGAAGAASAASATGAAPAAPTVIGGNFLGSGAGAAGSGSAAAGASGGLGVLGPAAAVAAYYGPSAWEHGSEVLKGKADGDSAVKSALMTNPLTAWTVPIMDWTGISFKSGKHEDARTRDAYRDWFRENTNIYGDHEASINLADGNVFSSKEFSGPVHDIDWEGGVNDDAIAALDALYLASLGGTTADEQAWTVGEFYNAANSGGDINANIDAIWENSGLSDWGNTRHSIDQAFQRSQQEGLQEGDRGYISQAERDAALATVDRRFGGADPEKRWKEIYG